MQTSGKTTESNTDTRNVKQEFCDMFFKFLKKFKKWKNLKN